MQFDFFKDLPNRRRLLGCITFSARELLLSVLEDIRLSQLDGTNRPN